MKKVSLIFILLLATCAYVCASEVSVFYPVLTDLDQKFFHFDQARLIQSADDYCVDIDITNPDNEFSSSDMKATLKQAWAKFSIHPKIDITLGKQYYPFNNVSTLASENVSLVRPFSLGSDWMVNVSGSLSDMKWWIYWADPGVATKTTDRGADIGMRLWYPIQCVKVGVSAQVEDAFGDGLDQLYHYGFDFSWLPMINVLFEVQAFVVDDSDDDTDDMNMWFRASYVEGIKIPVMKKMVPYVGYFTKNDENHDGMGESNMIFGLNFMPKDNIFIKMEYNLDSLDEEDAGFVRTGTNDGLAIQTGFTF